MFSRKAFPYFLSVLPVLLLQVLLRRGEFLFADSSFRAFSHLQVGEIFSLVHFSTNSFVSWRFEPASHFLFRPLGFTAYMSWAYFLLGLGVTCALHQAGRLSEIRSALISLAVTMLFLRWFGLDVVVISFSAALAWQVFVLSRYTENPSPGRLDTAFVVLTALLSCSFANQFALLAVILAALLILPARRDSKNRNGVPASLIIAFAYALFFPSPDFPGYNSHGHLVPFYNVTDGLQPLLGDAPPVLHINRDFVRSAYTVPALLALILSAGLILILWPRWRGKLAEAAPLWLALALSLGLVLDSELFSATFSQMAPLQSLTRVLPGSFFFAPAPLILGTIIFLTALRAASSVFTAALFACAVLFAFLGAPPNGDFRDELLWREAESLPGAGSVNAERLLSSPSYWLIREYGFEELDAARKLSALRFEGAAAFPVEVEASTNQGAVLNVKDGRDSTAWSTQGGAQKGGEWLNFHFPEPIRLAAIHWETGAYFTDFPRGIEVRTSGSCAPGDTRFESYRVVVPARVNQGEIRFTSEGFPYFASQYTNSVLLPEGDSVSCVLIRQTGRDTHFDWSVSEVSFARAAQ